MRSKFAYSWEGVSEFFEKKILKILKNTMKTGYLKPWAGIKLFF